MTRDALVYPDRAPPADGRRSRMPVPPGRGSPVLAVVVADAPPGPAHVVCRTTRGRRAPPGPPRARLFHRKGPAARRCAGRRLRGRVVLRQVSPSIGLWRPAPAFPSPWRGMWASEGRGTAPTAMIVET